MTGRGIAEALRELEQTLPTNRGLLTQQKGVKMRFSIKRFFADLVASIRDGLPGWVPVRASTYRKRVKELQSYCDARRNQCENLKARVEELKADREKCAKSFGEMRRRWGAECDKVVSLRAELATATNEREQLSGQFDTAVESHRNHIAGLKATHASEVNGLRAELSAVRARHAHEVEELSIHAENMRAAFDELSRQESEQLKDVRGNASRLQSSYDAAAKEIARLKGYAEELGKDVAHERSVRVKWQNNAEELEKRLEAVLAACLGGKPNLEPSKN